MTVSELKAIHPFREKRPALSSTPLHTLTHTHIAPHTSPATLYLQKTAHYTVSADCNEHGMVGSIIHHVCCVGCDWKWWMMANRAANGIAKMKRSKSVPARSPRMVVGKQSRD
uniref:Uncharacterized protein n=1 Tax=Vitrella brassicaformis TaxID=1169539 RepID=A0A7S1JRJ3_9ALVE|mmetsp:Transcript_20319/g.49382  ORF Transcript_20319/g.49382 Transcript_20319/m.49382 type:complete len:113 (+) Transcript_20319:626-964(+)